MEMISDEQDDFDFSAVAQEGQMNSSLRHIVEGSTPGNPSAIHGGYIIINSVTRDNNI